MDWTATRPRQLSVFRQRRVSKSPDSIGWCDLETPGGRSKGGRTEIPSGRRKGTSSGVLTTFNQAQSACINILMESKAICFHPSPEKCVQQCFSDKATWEKKILVGSINIQPNYIHMHFFPPLSSFWCVHFITIINPLQPLCATQINQSCAT